MALKGIQVVELAGLAPAPFCGMVLADFGASVIRVDKAANNLDIDCLANGKRSIALNLKHPKGIEIIRKLCMKSDVLIEPFRKGVMELLGIGPSVLLKDNPRLIYARLTGYGQSGPYSSRAGHDVNYVGLSGLLSLFGRSSDKPVFPVNTVADFGGGGLMCALGILLALQERHISGLGQVVDCSMVEGSAYLGSWLYRSQKLPVWGNSRGKNILDSGAHFYEVYETKDNKYMAVGALEPQFYDELTKRLKLKEDTFQFSNFEATKELFASKFLEKTQEEWCNIFHDCDACVTPVLSLKEAPNHVHNVQRQSFVKDVDSEDVPAPAPKLSRTPGKSQSTKVAPFIGQHTEIVLKDLGYSKDDIKELEDSNVITTHPSSKL